MSWIETLVLVVHVLVSLLLIGLILLQQGKGADAGAAFGSGASQTVFGSQGTGSFLSRTTAFLALVFFITSISLAVFAKHNAATTFQRGIQVPVAGQKAPQKKNERNSRSIPAKSDIKSNAVKAGTTSKPSNAKPDNGKKNSTNPPGLE